MASTRILTALALAALAALLYTPHLRDAPIYLAHDEVRFALHAHSIATTGRDLNGRVMPLYFAEPGFESGRDPMSIYLAALLLKVVPLSEAAVRGANAAVGIVDVVLMYFLAMLIFESPFLAVLAAGLLALTPAHFIFSRMATSVIYPVPFVLAWLICLVLFLERRTRGFLVASTACLGLGVYSYLACLLTMPVCFLLTCFALLRKKVRSTSYLMAAAGFLLPLVPLLVWHVQHPARYAQIVHEYGLYDSARFNPLQGLKDLTSYFSLGVRSDIYWRFFGPSFLFFSGDGSLIDSTREAGVFVWPVGILLPLGIYQILAYRRTPANVTILLAFVLAPLAAVLTVEVAIHRALVIVPLGILIATYGADYLLNAPTRSWRLAGVLVLLLVPVHFRHFYVDYFRDYPARSAGWFESNVRGGVEEVIDLAVANPRASLYLSNAIPFIDSYWSFYLIEHHQEGLLGRTVYYDPKEVEVKTLADHGLVLSPAGDPTGGRLTAAGWRTAGLITEPNGATSFSVYQR